MITLPDLPMTAAGFRAMAKKLTEYADALDGITNAAKSPLNPENAAERVYKAFERAPTYAAKNPHFAYFLTRYAMTKSLLIRAIGNGPNADKIVATGLATLMEKGLADKLPSAIRANRRGRNPDFFVPTGALHLFKDENGTFNREIHEIPEETIMVKTLNRR